MIRHYCTKVGGTTSNHVCFIPGAGEEPKFDDDPLYLERRKIEIFRERLLAAYNSVEAGNNKLANRQERESALARLADQFAIKGVEFFMDDEGRMVMKYRGEVYRPPKK